MTNVAADALCPHCGCAKRRPWRKCGQCGLDPSEDEELLVRSVYLSVERFEDGDERRRYRKELGELAQRVRAGESPAFDEKELARLRKQRRLVASVPFSAVLGAVLRLFLPAIIVIAVLVVIILVRRR